jgi:hypothetical protein
VQEIDEHLNVAAAFKTLEGSFETALAITGPKSRLGGELVHCFVTEDGTPHAGTLPEIEPVLRSFVSRFPQRGEISLQVMELVGTFEEKRSARLTMRRKILETAGPVAAHAFHEGSTLRAALWARLVAAAPDPESAARILKARTQLVPRFEPARGLVIDLTAVDPADYARTEALALVAELEQEFEYVGTDAEILGTDTDAAIRKTREKRATAALNRIKGAARQEERIAMLIDDILQHEDIGLQLITDAMSEEAHQTKFEKTVHEQIIRPMVEGGHSSIKAEDIAGVLPQIYKAAHPFSRGILLWLLAKHLAKYPPVNEAIRRTLHDSRSAMVDQYRPRIEEALGPTSTPGGRK